MRISTGMIYDSGLRSIQDRTSSLLRTQQQLSTGRRILTPSDDPVAAARALEVTQAKAVNLSQATTRDNAKSSLGLADAQLQSGVDLMARVRELTVQGGNSTLTASDRRAIAAELRARFEEMVGLANSRDGTGLYLFGGYQTGNKPFAGTVENGVVYGGDDGVRSLAVSASRNLAISDSGNDVFMNVKNGNGVFVTGMANEKSANANSVVYENGLTALTNPPNNTGEFELKFWVDTVGGVTTPAQAVGNLDLNAATAGAGLTLTTGVDSEFDVTVNGVTVNVDLDTAGVGTTYTSAAAIAAELQTQLDAGGASAIVNIDTNGALVVTSNIGGAGSNVSLADVNGLAAVFGAAPTISSPGTVGAANTTYYDLVDSAGNSLFTGMPSTTGVGGTFTHAYVPGTALDLSSAGPNAFDYGATIYFTGAPQTDDTFTVSRTSTALGVAPESVAAGAQAVMDKGTVTDPVKWTDPARPDILELRFWTDTHDVLGGGAGQVYYDIVDAATGNSLYTGNPSQTGAGGSYAGAYTSGAAISLQNAGPPAFDFGASVTVTGTPANGDTFVIATSQDATGNGFFTTEPKKTTQYNTGSGIVGVGEVLDQRKWDSTLNSRNLEVRFWQDPEDPDKTYYDLVDLETEHSLFTNTTSTSGGPGNTFTREFKAGDSISFDGLHTAYGEGGAAGDFGISVTIQGTPASGDAFSIKSSGTESVFDTFSRLITALEQGAPFGTLGGTHLGNEIGQVLNQISNIEDNFLGVRASIGTRLAEIDNLDSVGENLNLQYEETLSRLQDLDYAEAITKLTREQMELQAAQQSFTRISQLSLFNYL